MKAIGTNLSLTLLLTSVKVTKYSTPLVKFVLPDISIVTLSWLPTSSPNSSLVIGKTLDKLILPSWLVLKETLPTLKLLASPVLV